MQKQRVYVFFPLKKFPHFFSISDIYSDLSSGLQNTSFLYLFQMNL